MQVVPDAGLEHQRVELLSLIPLSHELCCSAVAVRKSCLCVLQLLHEGEILLEALVLSLGGSGGKSHSSQAENF